MHRGLRNSAAALVATGALLAGGCSGESSDDRFGANSAELTQAFDETKAYWQEQGEDVGAVALQTIVSGEVLCKTDTSIVKVITADAASPATYCGDKRTVYISSQSYAQMEKDLQAEGVSVKAVAAVAVGHEVAHDIIAQYDSTVKGQQNELTADCEAGQFIGATHPGLVPESKNMMTQLGSDGHGSSAEREGAFTVGVTMGKIGCNSIMLGTPLPG